MSHCRHKPGQISSGSTASANAATIPQARTTKARTSNITGQPDPMHSHRQPNCLTSAHHNRAHEPGNDMM
ncbi:MAG: hypothetical protein ACK55Z_21355, partial [bacterium]